MKRKLVAMVCSLACTVSMVSPCMAQEFHAPDTASVPVSFEQKSTFTVTLPETISGANGQTSVDFVYSVKGNIASDETVTLDLEDADTNTDGDQVLLKDVLNNEKYATISIEKESYAYNEIRGEGLTNDGTATFTGLTAGHWEGTAKFIIDLVTQ